MLTFEKNFTITVGNVVEGAPNTFNGNVITTIPDHNAPGYTVLNVTATGPDAGTDFTYALAGGADDAAFTLTGNVLTINGSTDFQTKQSYTVRLRATNAHAANLFYEEDFTFYVRGKALDVQFNDASIVAGATVNIGVQFPGDTTTFVLKNNGILAYHTHCGWSPGGLLRDGSREFRRWHRKRQWQWHRQHRQR
jgi:hypothetical protein